VFAYVNNIFYLYQVWSVAVTGGTLIHSCLMAILSAYAKGVNPKAAMRCFAGLTPFAWQIRYKQAGMDYSAHLRQRLGPHWLP